MPLMHKLGKRRIQVQIKYSIDSKSVVFRVLIPGGYALICTEFYSTRLKGRKSCPAFFAVSMPGFVQVCSRVSVRLSKCFEVSIK
jgi:hypothetical protein